MPAFRGAEPVTSGSAMLVDHPTWSTHGSQLTELRGMSVDELIQEYDRVAKSTTNEGIAYLREEIFHRKLAEQGDRMERLTNQMNRLTWVMTVLTVLNTYAVFR
jgi:hypothetical protein